MSDVLPLATVDLFRIDPDGATETRAGGAEYHGDGQLVLIDAEPAFEAKLRSAIQAVNRKPRIVELAPPASAAQKFATAARVTERGDQNFMQALNRYLRAYYGFGLG